MKAIKYTVMICNGWLEYSHQMQYPITEYFIPELKVCINIGDGDFNVILEQIKPRNPVKGSKSEIDLPPLLANMVMRDIENKRFHEEVRSKIAYLFESPKKVLRFNRYKKAPLPK
jgi:hypothetical protein